MTEAGYIISIIRNRAMNSVTGLQLGRVLWFKRQAVFIGDGHDEEEAALSSGELATTSVSSGLRLSSGSPFVF